MKRIRRAARVAAVLVLTGLGLGACASADMKDAAEPGFVNAPAGDTATLVFLRPSALGFAYQSIVYDVTAEPPALVGIVSSGRKIAITAPPGVRRYMVVSEAADFMDAELAAGRTYYTLVTPRIGMWRARFSLKPMSATAPELAGYLGQTSWVENTQASHEWARLNMPSVRAKKAEYLPEWLAKPNKPVLVVSDGR